MTVEKDTLAENQEEPKIALLLLRLGTLMVLMCLLTIHLRSMRLFRWELSVTGGLVIAYCVAEVGLALCAGTRGCSGHAIQAYFCGTGAALLAVNGGVIWQRWKKASQMTRVVAELLDVVGVPLKRQVVAKVILSAVAAGGMLADLVLASHIPRRSITP